jgi:long-chain acyl-CoA synthetase
VIQITQGLHRSAALFPERIATVFGARRRTWREIEERVARLAAGLVSLGVAPGDRVGMLALNSDRYVEMYLAIAWAGAVAVPANTRWALPEHVYGIEDSGTGVLFADTAFAAMAGEIAAQTPLRALIHADDGESPAGMTSYEALIVDNDRLPDRCGRDHDLAAIFYTGGTTGRSKGVMLSHHSLIVAYLMTMTTMGIAGRQVYLHSPPMFHLADAGLVFGITLTGGTHVIIPYFTPQAVIDAVAAEGVTDVVLVPTMIGMLRDHIVAHGGDLSSIRNLSYGASAISESLLRHTIDLLPNAAIRQCYGQTETSSTAVVLAAEHHKPAPQGESRLRSAGQAMVGARMRIADENLADVPIGQVGEVLLRTPGAMLGYWNQPDLTALTLVDGWVRTGDAGYLDENGFLYLVDRVKDMIVSGGENVYSAEVENALAGHPAIRECAVIGVPDDRWGERVHAIVCLYPDRSVAADEIIAHCKSLIATYKCPRSVEFRREPLPLSGAGKVLKTVLREPHWRSTQRAIA